MRGPEAENSAEARRRSDGAAGVGSEGKIDKACCNRRGGARRGSARDASRCRDIDRRSVVFVLAGQAHDEFCRDGRPDERGARVEEFLHHRRRLCCWLVSGQPIGVAATCNATGDIEDILGGECQACERPSACTGNRTRS